MSRTVLVVLAFIGIFAAGVVSGGLVGVRISQRLAQQKVVEQLTQQQWKRLLDQLQLTPQQMDQVRAILTTGLTDIQTKRRAIGDEARQMEDKIENLLTPEQRDIFDRARNRMRENEKVFQRWLREQRQRRQEMWNKNAPGTPALP